MKATEETRAGRATGKGAAAETPRNALKCPANLNPREAARMTERIKVKKLTQPRISADGRTIHFTAIAADGPAFDAEVPTDELRALIPALIALSASAVPNEAATRAGKTPLGIPQTGGAMPQPQFLLVSQLQLSHLPRIGTLVLRLEDARGAVLDIGLPPLQAQDLKEQLHGVGPPPPAARSH
ncbi:MAG: hypothetical protein ACRCZI_11115 [Cetobacterium sp.]